MKRIVSALSVLIVAIVVVFAVQNLGVVEVRFLFWSTEVSLAVPMIGAYLLGGLTLRRVLRLLAKNRQNRKEAKRGQAAEQKPASTAERPKPPGS
jgi:uncharacterized integral membrane protein